MIALVVVLSGGRSQPWRIRQDEKCPPHLLCLCLLKLFASMANNWLHRGSCVVIIELKCKNTQNQANINFKLKVLMCEYQRSEHCNKIVWKS